MYDPNRWKEFHNLTVKQLCDYLLDNVPHDAELNICGDNYVYIHIEQDGSVVSLDNCSLDDLPEYQEAVNPELVTFDDKPQPAIYFAE